MQFMNKHVTNANNLKGKKTINLRGYLLLTSFFTTLNMQLNQKQNQKKKPQET